jgi:hypothetical protein
MVTARGIFVQSAAMQDSQDVGIIALLVVICVHIVRQDTAPIL